MTSQPAQRAGTSRFTYHNLTLHSSSRRQSCRIVGRQTSLLKPHEANGTESAAYDAAQSGSMPPKHRSVFSEEHFGAVAHSSDNALAGRESLGGSTSEICAYRRKLEIEDFTLYGSISREYARRNRNPRLSCGEKNGLRGTNRERQRTTVMSETGYWHDPRAILNFGHVQHD